MVNVRCIYVYICLYLCNAHTISINWLIQNQKLPKLKQRQLLQRLTQLLNKKLEDIKSKISSSYTINLLLATGENVPTIINYIDAMDTEINYSSNYGNDTIGSLYRFSKYHKNKPFKEITRNDIVEFLDSLRKTETHDPLHKWVGNYNLCRIYLLRFFRWFYSPDIEPSKETYTCSNG